MNTKLFFSPFFAYSVAYLAIFLLYEIGWSTFYPPLHGFVLNFLLLTISVCFFLSLILTKVAKKKPDLSLTNLFVKRSLYFIFFGYTAEFVYEKSIPIISTFLNSSYDYKDFNGVPTFHVILSTYSIFFSVASFNNYLTSKNRKNLYVFIASIIPYILVINRGAFMIVFSAMIFMYISTLNSLKIKVILKSLVVLLGVLYMFGIIGNFRQKQTKNEKEYLLRVGGASDKFINSGIPAEFYWSYIYVISPLGNLQNIVDKKADEFDSNNIGIFASSELFPNFISKRITSIFDYDDVIDKNLDSRYLVTINLNASTTYYRSYYYLGSIGMYIMFGAILISSLLYPVLVRKNKYSLVGISSFNAIVFLSMFNNMWFDTGIILFWPILINFWSRIKFK